MRRFRELFFGILNSKNGIPADQPAEEEGLMSDQDDRTPETDEERRLKADAWRKATVPILDTLRRWIREAGFSQRRVEEGAAFSKGYLAQLLGRNLDLKMWHVMAILNVLDRSVVDLFEEVYPRSRRYPALETFQRSSKPLREEMDQLLAQLYRHGGHSLEELYRRLEKCERTVERLEELGILTEARESRG